MALGLRGDAGWNAIVEGLRKDLIKKFFGSEEAYKECVENADWSIEDHLKTLTDDSAISKKETGEG